jgi:hypothetical protein
MSIFYATANTIIPDSNLEQPENNTHPLPIYTFIHIPKCGGTAVENYFLKYYSDRITGTTHKWVATTTNNPIIILRDPIERFISLYHYWKNGSHGRNSRNKDFTDKYGNYTIKDFIRLIKDHRQNELVVGYMWRVHYHPQINWIPKETYKNAIIITYVNNLNHKIRELLEYCDISYNGISLERSNVTRKKEGEDVVLDSDDYDWLHEHFKEDFELWENAFLCPELFKKVI